MMIRDREREQRKLSVLAELGDCAIVSPPMTHRDDEVVIHECSGTLINVRVNLKSWRGSAKAEGIGDSEYRCLYEKMAMDENFA